MKHIKLHRSINELLYGQKPCYKTTVQVKNYDFFIYPEPLSLSFNTKLCISKHYSLVLYPVFI